jgi:type I restriction enzyme, S subunit
VNLPHGWTDALFSDITPPNAPIIYGILQPGPDIDGGVPYVRPTEIYDGRIKLSELRRTSLSVNEQYVRSSLKADDIILSIVGTIGKVARVPVELEGGNITQSSCRIRVDTELAEPPFVCYFLRSGLAVRQFNAKRLGTAVPRLNIGDIRQFSIRLAPLSEQRRIVAKLDALLAHIARAEAELDRVSALASRFRSQAVRSAFRGDLSAPWRAGRGDESKVDDESDALPASWHWTILGELVDIKSGVTLGRSVRQAPS